jgi:hypothetical protein
MNLLAVRNTDFWRMEWQNMEIPNMLQVDLFGPGSKYLQRSLSEVNNFLELICIFFPVVAHKEFQIIV